MQCCRISFTFRHPLAVFGVLLYYLCVHCTNVAICCIYIWNVCVGETFTYNDMHVQITFIEFRMHHKLRCDGNSLLKCMCVCLYVILHTGHHHHWYGAASIVLYASNYFSPTLRFTFWNLLERKMNRNISRLAYITHSLTHTHIPMVRDTFSSENDKSTSRLLELVISLPQNTYRYFWYKLKFTLFCTDFVSLLLCIPFENDEIHCCLWLNFDINGHTDFNAIWTFTLKMLLVKCHRKISLPAYAWCIVQRASSSSICNGVDRQREEIVIFGYLILVRIIHINTYMLSVVHDFSQLNHH